MQLALIQNLTASEASAVLALGLCATALAVFGVIYLMDKNDREEREAAAEAKLANRAKSVASAANYNPKDIFHLNGKEWSASGFGTASGIVVQKGSIVRKEAFSSLTDKLHNLRQSFVDNGILVDEEGGDELVLRTDFEFDSSTAAASFVTGRKASGPYNWKDENGLTFGEYTNQNIPSA